MKHLIGDGVSLMGDVGRGASGIVRANDGRRFLLLEVDPSRERVVRSLLEELPRDGRSVSLPRSANF
jgi:hypothetical protein